MGDHSTFLFATPSFAEGVGRILDFGDTLTGYNRSPNEQVADARAVASDWRAVGDDLRFALQAKRAELGNG